MHVQMTKTRLGPILVARDEWERKRKRLEIAAQIARLEEDDESVTWFEREYLAAHARYQETCRSLKTRARRNSGASAFSTWCADSNADQSAWRTSTIDANGSESAMDSLQLIRTSVRR
jgi:hypothetical protein